MIGPSDLAARHTELSVAEFGHLQRLMGAWGVLSDLSFSDLLLLVRVRGSLDGQLVVLGQIRPTTGATLIRIDLVGQIVEAGDWAGSEDAFTKGEMVQGTIDVTSVVPSTSGQVPRVDALAAQEPVVRYPQTTGEVPAIGEHAQIECLPISSHDRVVAVLARVGPLVERRTGRLERVYRDLYRRLAAMVVAGEFPHPSEEVVSEDAPRVGDGLMVTDSEGRVSYSSPNAMSALHRMGVSDAVEGRRLSEVGIEDTAIESALGCGRPVIEEVERRPDVIVLVHCTPLIERGTVTGSMVLLRDVTDLRRLDRLLLSKDAAIREVHHRVKNNLQTISSLLRLQARRLEPGKGQEALRESERRVRSIAVVHEILSREPGDQVSFGEIVAALIRMTEDSAVSRKVHITLSGDAGDLPADMATPLAVALAEILQNAIEHAFPEVSDDEMTTPGNVHVVLSNDSKQLTLEVRDDGCGLPEGFDIDESTSLGLSIVRDLIRSQLAGSISMQATLGTTVRIEVPLPE